jgi:hypothetical protein
MNINSVGSSNTLASLIQTNSTTGGSSSSATSSTGAATQTHVSPLGELMSKLQQLQQQDPAQFKQVAGQLATSLQQAAQQSGDSNGFLSQLANGLQQAAQTGQMPTFQPPTAASAQAASGQTVKHHGSGHHRHGGGEASGAVKAAFSTALTQVNAALGESSGTTSTTT